jgi:hypothetical protein
LAWATVCGVIVFMFAPVELGIRIGAALLVGAACFAFLTWRERQRKSNPRLVTFYREKLGGDGPFRCEVEIDASGVIIRQFGSETKHPWSQIESVSDSTGGIEFVYKPMGSLLVRDRAFANSAARAEFLALARGYVPRPAGSTV